MHDFDEITEPVQKTKPHKKEKNMVCALFIPLPQQSGCKAVTGFLPAHDYNQIRMEIPRQIV